MDVTVTNSGDRAGKHSVELYLSDVVRSVSPPLRQLKRFTVVDLKPGESTKVEFKLNRDDLSFFGRKDQFIVEPGEFKVMVGTLSDTFHLVKVAASSDL